MRLPRAWLATILATTTASAILMGAQSVPPPGRLPLLPRGDFLRPVHISGEVVPFNSCRCRSCGSVRSRDESHTHKIRNVEGG